MAPPRGPKRSKDRDIYPPRFHIKGNVCYHVGSRPPRAWTKIGTAEDIPTALKEWGRIEFASSPLVSGTFGAIAAKFSALLEDPANTLRLAERTRKEYLRILRAAPPSTLQRAFGQMRMTDIESHHVADYLDQHPAPKMANREIQVVSKLYRWCIRKGLAGVKLNPCLIERNPEPKRLIYVTDAQYVAVWRFAWESAPKRQWQRFAAAMDISLITGWREGEVLRIREGHWDDIELKGSETKDPAKRMRVPMIPALQAALDRAVSVRRQKTRRTVTGVHHLHPPIFVGRGGKPLGESGFKAGWGRMLRAALKAGAITKDEWFHFHDIRAKHADDREDDLAQLALGHTDKRMTAKYIRNPKGRKYPALDAPAAGGGTKKQGENK